MSFKKRWKFNKDDYFLKPKPTKKGEKGKELKSPKAGTKK